MRTFKVLVTGGRDYANAQKVDEALSALAIKYGRITHLIHGGAPGWDTLAADWAWDLGIQVVTCKANWDFYPKNAAGPIRNRAMGQLGADVCLAGPGGSGTAHMIEEAEKVHIEVLRA